MSLVVLCVLHLNGGHSLLKCLLAERLVHVLALCIVRADFRQTAISLIVDVVCRHRVCTRLQAQLSHVFVTGTA